MSSLETKWLPSMSAVGREAWNSLAVPAGNPMLLWEYLNLLETTGNVSPGTGWTPAHFTLWRGKELAAAAPMYIKTASAGEFVFDYLWVEVAERVGKPYYPKLVGMAPLTPCRGYRLLTEPGAETELTLRLLEEVEAYCRRRKIHAAAFHFCDPSWSALLSGRPANDYTAWNHVDFIMHPKDFSSWEDYIRHLSKNARKNARRETESMAEQNIVLRMVPGREAPDSYYGLMWEYYADTNRKFGPWAAMFLNREFFRRLKEAMPDNHIFCAAYKGRGAGEQGNDEPVGLSLFFTSAAVLLGRYWGANDFYQNLHFNVCYYEPVRWAIGQGIGTFDPGMGGDHKARRGFLPQMHASMHRFFDPLMEAVFKGNIHVFNDH
ncbi:MAG: GNAT family N-acetyltransferase, partial [Spirochaetales bacterium]